MLEIHHSGPEPLICLSQQENGIKSLLTSIQQTATTAWTEQIYISSSRLEFFRLRVRGGQQEELRAGCYRKIAHIEGSCPEWCISSMIYSRDTPFWLETLDSKLDQDWSDTTGKMLNIEGSRSEWCISIIYRYIMLETHHSGREPSICAVSSRVIKLLSLRHKDSNLITLVARGFLRVLRFPPLLHGINDSANKISSNKCDFNSVKLNSWAVPSYRMAHNTTLARDQRSMDLHTIAPGPLERACWRQFAALWGDR